VGKSGGAAGERSINLGAEQLLAALSADRARRLLAALWGEWLYGEPVQPSNLQEGRLFAEEELGITVAEARDLLAASYPVLAREFLRRAHDQRDAEAIYWETLSRRVNAGSMSSIEAVDRLRKFSEAG
jgi:hypothetical protein